MSAVVSAARVRGEAEQTYGVLLLLVLARCSSGAMWWAINSGSGSTGDWGQSGGMLGEGVLLGRGVIRWRTALRRLIPGSDRDGSADGGELMET